MVLDTNWGGQSLLDEFFDYGVAFFSTVSGRLGDYRSTKEGDLLAVSNPDSKEIVAIGEVLTPFKPLRELGVLFSQSMLDEYGDDTTIGCRAKFYLLKKDERCVSSDYKRFYRIRVDSSISYINTLYDTHKVREDQGEFDIKPRTQRLFEKHSDDNPEFFSLGVRYRVPVYQRPYSWGETEIGKLIEDMFEGVPQNEKKFIGTLQLSEPVPLDAEGRTNAYDVIDGQQRITTLLLVLLILQKKWGLFKGIELRNFLRTSVNRGEAQRSLDSVWEWSPETAQNQDGENTYCRNLRFIESALDEHLSPNEGDSIEPKKFEEYLKKNLLMVVIETHAPLSKTLEIFDIINTTGLDLNGADVFKIRFYEFLKTKRPGKLPGEQEVFDKVSELYQDIEKRNRTGKIKSSMPEILQILQALIVGKYGLSVGLMDYAADRFFGDLFDALLGRKESIFGKDKVDRIIEDSDGPLSIEGMRKLIELRYEYGSIAEVPDEGQTPVLSLAFMHKMMFESRYSRYWFYPIIFRYRFVEDSRFREELLKLALVYSLIHAKAVYKVHTCVKEACSMMFEEQSTAEKVLDKLKGMRLEGKSECEKHIRDWEIAGNRKWKLIVCRLSEFLEYDCKIRPISNTHSDFNRTPIPVISEHVFRSSPNTFSL